MIAIEPRLATDRTSSRSMRPTPENPRPNDATPGNAVEIVDLCKTYAAGGRAPAKRALDGVSLTVKRGEIFDKLGFEF